MPIIIHTAEPIDLEIFEDDEIFIKSHCNDKECYLCGDELSEKDKGEICRAFAVSEEVSNYFNEKLRKI